MESTGIDLMSGEVCRNTTLLRCPGIAKQFRKGCPGNIDFSQYQE